MNRIGVITFVFLLTLLAALGGVIYLRGDVLLKYLLETYGRSSCECQFQIGELFWNIKKPLTLNISHLTADLGEWGLDIDKLNLVIHPSLLKEAFDSKIQVDLNLKKVKLNYNATLAAAGEGTSSSRQSSRQLAKKIDGLKRLSFRFNISDLELNAKLKNNQSCLLKLSKLNHEFDGSRLVLKWDFASQLTPPKEIFDQPLEMASQGAAFRNSDKLELSNTVLKIMGVPIEVSGGMVVETNAIDFNVKINNVDLAHLKADLTKSPISQLSGSVSVDAHLMKAASLDPWQAAGKVSLQAIKGRVNFNGEKYSIQGPMKLDLAGEGKYQADRGLEFPQLEWILDLTEAQLSIGSLLNKPPQIKLGSQAKVRYEQGLNIKSSSFQMGDMNISVDGLIDNSNLADLNFKMNPLNLLGMEKVFPFLSNYPIVGQAEVSGRYAGDLMHPEKANLVLEKLFLENIQGKVDWKSDETTLSGPFLVNLKGSLNVLGKEVKKGDLELKIDLTAMDIQQGTLFRKPSQSLLELSVLASQEQGALKVKEGALRGPFGVVGIQGILPVPPVYSMNLKISTNQLNFAPLKNWIPSFANIIPDGNLKGSFETSGDLKTSDLLNSRLFSKGDLKILIPYLQLPARDKAMESKNTIGGEYLPEPILPSTHLLQAMALNLDVMVGTISWKELLFSNVHLVSQIAEGKARGQSSIGKILDGSIEFPVFEIPLFEGNPSASFNIKPNKINVAKGLEIFLPIWKDFAQGFLSGEFVGLTKLPSSSTFLSDLQSSGNFKITQGSLRNIPIKTALENIITPIPLGNGLFRSFVYQNSNLLIKSEFSLGKQQLNVKPLVIQSAEGHDLTVEGQVGFDKIAELQGQLMVAKLKGGGSFYEANKDGDGRLLLPVSIEGNLLHPEVKIISGALTEMASKTSYHERTRSIANEEQQSEKSPSK